MILVPLFDLKFLNVRAANGVGTSNRRHWQHQPLSRVSAILPQARMPPKQHRGRATCPPASPGLAPSPVSPPPGRPPARRPPGQTPSRAPRPDRTSPKRPPLSVTAARGLLLVGLA